MSERDPLEGHRPAPVKQDFSAPFWKGAAEGKFLLQYCPESGQYQFYPRPVSIRTGKRNLEWREVSGRGTVYSHTVTYRSPIPVKGKYVAATDKEAEAMLAKGDLKFRLKGKRLKGDFALVHIKSRRPGSKGNEWLMIKKHDDEVVEGVDAEQYDTSVLTKRTLAKIAGDEGSAQWTSSRPASRGALKAPWLAETLARIDKKKRQAKTAAAPAKEKKTKKVS